MRWSQLRKIAVSLPLAVLAAITLVSINEAGYQRSRYALEDMAHSQSTRASLNKLLQSMLDAESGHRGYLLTGDERYLEPYERSVSTVNANLDELRSLFHDSPADIAQFAQLSRQVSRKLSEMELSLRLRRQGNEDAWKFVMSTDVGKENMDAIRTLARDLIERKTDRIAQSERQVERSLLLARLGIAAVTAIGLLAFYMYLRQATVLQRATEREQEILRVERARLEGLVRDRTASLSELADHLQQVREDERGHLARELHDELGALLTAAKLDVARLKSKIDVQAPEVSERLHHLIETLNSGIALKRRIIEDLRPSSLANLGLTAALEILTREYADRAGIDVQTSLETVELPEATQLTVYRMVQESLTNIGKYANAKKVLVTVHNYPTHVAVQIRDDGDGFDPSGIRRNSHGLVGMRQRVEAAGGRLTVSSQPGQGTLVSAILPTKPALPAQTA
ncbi:histidine kinase [Acidovorax sp. SRB_14]|uniref:sensor histidine kinase n=1 Tax=unclassified Acidovorax TaxID=2684926 RepID=UPI00145CED94|nr:MULTISPECIES: CHASE3 domain-containing protein [unclassified Acidovorax]NMM77716.1 histidine kinase [Acidovorax sp. SRB_24]NMM80637.1 histidine kinase [Acidovorax sp. SRB_14]NMM87639.1 histidine kinase [Rhodococcus sp. SRB_17]